MFSEFFLSNFSGTIFHPLTEIDGGILEGDEAEPQPPLNLDQIRAQLGGALHAEPHLTQREPQRAHVVASQLAGGRHAGQLQLQQAAHLCLLLLEDI